MHDISVSQLNTILRWALTFNIGDNRLFSCLFCYLTLLYRVVGGFRGFPVLWVLLPNMQAMLTRCPRKSHPHSPIQELLKIVKSLS